MQDHGEDELSGRIRTVLNKLKQENIGSAGVADEKGQNGGYHLNINLNINQ